MRAIAVLIAALAFAQEVPQAWVLGKPVNAQRPGVPVPEQPWKVVAAEIKLMLIEDYSRAQGLEPTPEEIAAVRARMKSPAGDAVLVAGNGLRRDLLRAGLDPQAVERQVEAFRAEEKARDERFVLTLIRYWKVGRDLHRKHGGRVRLSAFGFHEPMDATERFLIEQERQGRFSIPNLDFRAKVWSVFQDKSGGDGTVSGAQAEAIYLNPPWQRPLK